MTRLDHGNHRPTRSRARRGFRIASLLVALVSLATLPGGAAAAPPPPTIAITTPAAGAAVKGTVPITASAAAGDGDTLYSIQFYDGASSLGTFLCQSQPTCTVTYSWRATTLSGPHSLTARVSSSASLNTTSAAVAVTVENPPPTVAVVSPASGATVSGSVDIAATASTDPSLEDYPYSIALYDGVNSLGSRTCQAQTTCQVSVTKDFTGATGVHVLTAKVTTNRGVAVTSPADSVTILSPAPQVTITKPKSRPGSKLPRNLSIHVQASTHPSQVDHPYSITVYDGANSIGSLTCDGQRVCAGVWKLVVSGSLTARHRLTAVVTTSKNVTATSKAVLLGGPYVKRKVVPVCHLDSLKVPLRRIDNGTCVIKGVPNGTRVAVQYKAGTRWIPVVTGKARNGSFAFTLRGAKRTTFDLRFVVDSSKSTRQGIAAIGVLQIG